jgi:hypothetical protein
MDPYRQQAVRAEIPIEIEAEALRHVAEHKQKVQGVFTAIGLILGLATTFACCIYFDSHGDLWLSRTFGPMRAAAFVFFVPLLISQGLWRLWLRARRERWIRAASVRFNIPAEALEWVTREPE